MTTMQLDALANCQNKLKTQTSNQLSTIMVQLESNQANMEEQRNWQDHYNEYKGYDRDRPFTPEQSNMDKDTNDTNEKLTPQAASNSHMEDASHQEWDC